MWKQPKAILNILTKRKMDNVPGYEIPLPELRQIRNYKRNTNTPNNNEYEEVLRKINELSSNVDYPDDRQAFTYGVKFGIGSDNDPFIVCFTSKYLLSTMSRYSHHSSTYILQDASYAEANAANEVFGSTVMIVMCWFHLIFNVKKHEF